MELTVLFGCQFFSMFTAENHQQRCTHTLSSSGCSGGDLFSPHFGRRNLLRVQEIHFGYIFEVPESLLVVVIRFR